MKASYGKGPNTMFFTERSKISSLYVFAQQQLMSGHLTVEQFQQLEKKAEEISKPNLILSLRIPPEIALERIQKRTRGCEKDITLDYLEQLQQREREAFKQLGPNRVWGINGTRSKQFILDHVTNIIDGLILLEKTNPDRTLEELVRK